jgi:LytR cell envelope-related transcriptional attenuator
VSGRHEPGSRSGFYISVTTAVLRAGLVIVAVVLGVFALTKAFPEDGTEVQTQTPGSTTPSPADAASSPPATVAPTPSPGQVQSPAAPVNLDGVTVQVLNGTNEDGLAATTAQNLEQLGVKILGVGNAARTYPITTLFFRPSDSQPIAEALAQAQFPGAKLEPATNNLEPDVQVTVVLGEDYAAQH